MEPMTTLINLGGIAAIALGAVALLWRVSGQERPQRGAIVQGYPPDLFPAHDVVQSSALSTLAATQSRLLSLYAETPVSSDSARLLHTFLHELRGIMDLAYRVALATRAYGPTPQLERLVSEVQEIEAQLVDHVIHRMLAYEADQQAALLTARLESLRQCVDELTPAAEGRIPLLEDDSRPAMSRW
jgi:hypothetical protein